jgi:phospholipase/carboxylesterase
MSALVHELRPAAGEPQGALVLLHGRGADEHDLHPFLDMLDPQRRLVGLTPGAPLHLPPGGRHWYVVPRVGFPEPDSFRASYELLAREVPELTGVPWERTVVGGFSQGSVMAYALGLGAGRPTPAGIVAMSGFIPTVDGWTADLDRPGLPVWIAHGRRDPVIGVQFAHAARDALAASPVQLTYREHEGAHQVDPRALAELPAWVAQAVGNSPRSRADDSTRSTATS